ncbi:MAG: trifunctional dihydropteroate synthetase [Pycnora praestabilis]|nr:MAG: trifunctional dihydropteroate synthetase [Pycnora praestabilis]
MLPTTGESKGTQDQNMDHHRVVQDLREMRGELKNLQPQQLCHYVADFFLSRYSNIVKVTVTLGASIIESSIRYTLVGDSKMNSTNRQYYRLKKTRDSQMIDNSKTTMDNLEDAEFSTRRWIGQTSVGHYPQHRLKRCLVQLQMVLNWPLWSSGCGATVPAAEPVAEFRADNMNIHASKTYPNADGLFDRIYNHVSEYSNSSVFLTLKDLVSKLVDRAFELNCTESNGRILSYVRIVATEPSKSGCLQSGVEIERTASDYGQPNFQRITELNANGIHRVFIALGSNMGDRTRMIEAACNEMNRRGIKVVSTSSLWETEAMYVMDQGRFVNGTCEVETTLEPLKLLDQLQDIEKLLGRVKIKEKGPRNIDLDILLYDSKSVDSPRLSIPHKSMLEREFVLRPLCELIPNESLPPPHPPRPLQTYLKKLPIATPPLSTLVPICPAQSPLTPLTTTKKTHIMAVLNITPDSFSDGGLHSLTDPTTLTNTINHFVATGATILDIGGQSTRPNAPSISAAEETSRILPVITLIRSLPSASKVCISIDTYRASVAAAAIAAGADMINDVSAGVMDPEMLPTVAKLGVTICLMHMRGTPQTMKDLTHYPAGLIPTIGAALASHVAAAQAAGIPRWRLMLDPGIGFAKTQAQNLELLRRLDDLRNWEGLVGIPWLVGASRKGFVGKITGVTEARERSWGTAGCVSAAVQGGADVVRVHDVEEMTKVVKMADAIWRV